MRGSFAFRFRNKRVASRIIRPTKVSLPRDWLVNIGFRDDLTGIETLEEKING
jgi:hypothetical protein